MPEHECTELDRLGADEAPPEAPPDEPLVSAPPPVVRGRALPWSGRHLTVREAWELTARGPARLIAVAGPYNAGKTCLLASLFLQLANGRRPGLPYRFAGCRTLNGYDRLTKQAAGYTGHPNQAIVDHTPTAETDDPSAFLHLALRPEVLSDDRVLEILLSDVAGEWFSDWAQVDDAAARRRLPFLERCDALLLLSDAAAILGEGGGAYDGRNAQVLRRLVELQRARRHPLRVWVVYTKLDRVLDRVTPPPPGATSAADWGVLGKKSGRTWGAIKALRNEGVQVTVSGVSAFPGPLAAGQPYGVTELLGDVVTTLERPWRAPAAPLPLDVSSPFGAMHRERP